MEGLKGLPIMHGWPRISSQAPRGALPICCLDTYRWSWVGTCFVTLLDFACVPIPCAETCCWQNHNRNYDRCDLHDVQDEKHNLFYALAKKWAIWEGNLQNNLLILLIGFTLVTQVLFTVTTSVLRMWDCFLWSRRTNHFFFFLRLWIFCLARSAQQAQQSTHLAGGFNPL